MQSVSLYLTFSQDTITSLYNQIQGQKPHSPIHMENFNEKGAVFGVQTAPSIFLNLMFKLFVKYLEEIFSILDGWLINL